MLTSSLKHTIQTAYRNWLQNKGLRSRAGQRQMIAEIARTLAQVSIDNNDDDKREPPVCVVEAGTGTGKTIAYTMAAIPIAQAIDKKLIISTATVALQEQIVHKDLPDVLEHSGLSFNVALAKGRGRYLCLAKLDQLLRGAQQTSMVLDTDDQPATDTVDVQALTIYHSMHEALQAKQWGGDRDSWAEPLSSTQWSALTTDHIECTGRRCPHIKPCCFYQARDQLEKADVIVSNHDLVLADLALGGGVVLTDPRETLYVFDEGHHLADKALDHFSDISRLRATEHGLEQGLQSITKAAIALGHAAGIDQYLQALPAPIKTLKQHMQMLFTSLESLLSPSEQARHEHHRFTHGIVPEALRTQAVELVAQCRQIQRLLAQSCVLLEEALDAPQHPINQADAQTWYPIFALFATRIDEQVALWDDYSTADSVQDPPNGRWISLVEDSDGQFDIEVTSSPIVAAAALHNALWSHCAGAVVTSATLTAIGRFDRLQMRIGPPASTCYAVVPSPFHYPQAELHIPALRCEPRDVAAHTDALVARLPDWLADDNGSLVLFASRQQMQTVFDGLPEGWRQRVLKQGDDGKQALLRRHRAAIDNGEASVLFGLASFAEGIDLPGQYCTHVVIAKIPFAVPDQPLEQALAEWVERRGGNPFIDIAVPDAALRLVQASGRLLRTESDSGKVTICDRRLVTRRYGQLMLNALPPFKRCVEEVAAVNNSLPP